MTINEQATQETQMKAFKHYLRYLESIIDKCEAHPKTYSAMYRAEYEGEFKHTAALCIDLSKSIRTM